MIHAPSNCTIPAKGRKVNDSLTIIILSAGIGRRMKSKGVKALLPIENSNVLEYQLKTFWKVYPSAEIIVVTGFQGNKVRSRFRGIYPVRFVYNPNYETTNVMYSVSLALEANLSSNTIIAHGDILFNSTIISEITGKSSKILVLPEINKSNEQEVGVVINDNCVTNLSYGLKRRWGQMVYITGKETSLFENIAFNHSVSSSWFLYEGINHVIDKGGIFVAHSPRTGHWLEIDGVDDLELVNTRGMIL